MMFRYLKQEIEERNRAGSNVSFLVVGACDGVSFDNSAEIVENVGSLPYLKKIYVEPVPWIFEELRKNISLPNSHFVNAALFETDRELTINTVPKETFYKEYKKDPDDRWLIGVSTITMRNGLGGNSFWAADEDLDNAQVSPPMDIAKIQVNGITLQTLMNENQLSNVDMIQIDTEGYDYEIFKQLDFEKMSPCYIKMEIGCLKSGEIGKIIKTLSIHEYKIYMEGVDITAFKFKK